MPKHSKKGKSKRPGLWANIHAKRKRIKAGSGERMRKLFSYPTFEMWNIAY